MKDYKRLTDKTKAEQLVDCYDCTYCGVGYLYDCHIKVCERLAELEDKIEQGELVSVKEVAKFLDFMCNDYPCNYIFDTLEVSEYMVEKYGDWCEENCSKHGQDCTPCWEMFLKAKLKEIQNE